MIRNIKKTYFVNGIQVPSIVDYIRIRRMDSEYTLKDMLRIFHKPDNPDSTQPEELKKLWNDPANVAYTSKEFLKKFHNNSELLMMCFSIAGAEATLSSLKSTIVDQETITKKQKRTYLKEAINLKHNKKQNLIDDNKFTKGMFEEKFVEYKDTYKLYMIGKDQLNTINNIYIIECNCQSTGRNFFLFVDSTDPNCQKAINAIAWTMRKPNGTPLTREEYILLEQES